MNTIKKRKFRKFEEKNKKFIVGSGIFILIGLTALIVGFEIANDWQAMRKWLASPYATTFFVCFGIGAFCLIVIILAFIAFKRGNE